MVLIFLTATAARNHRTPLKARRRVTTETFEPLGEIDPDTLLNPGEEGWRQTFYAMSSDNEYWATIHAGAHALLGHVRDVQVAVMLRDAVGRWGSPAVRPSRIRRILPPRLSAWQRANCQIVQRAIFQVIHCAYYLCL